MLGNFVARHVQVAVQIGFAAIVDDQTHRSALSLAQILCDAFVGRHVDDTIRNSRRKRAVRHPRVDQTLDLADEACRDVVAVVEAQQVDDAALDFAQTLLAQPTVDDYAVDDRQVRRRQLKIVRQQHADQLRTLPSLGFDQRGLRECGRRLRKHGRDQVAKQPLFDEAVGRRQEVGADERILDDAHDGLVVLGRQDAVVDGHEVLNLHFGIDVLSNVEVELL